MIEYQDKYQFSTKPQQDGSMPILKNGELSICIKSPLIPIEGLQIGKVEFRRFACNNRCPFSNKVLNT